MGLHGKLIATIEFKAGGDVFHELLRHSPHDLPKATPDIVQACDLHEGEFGHVGSIICWTFTHDGKERKLKEVIQAIDEAKRLIEFKVLEGYLLELYKDFVISCHVETTGDVDLVTWTFVYEMLNEDVEHPTSLLSLAIDFTKDIETHHLGKP